MDVISARDENAELAELVSPYLRSKLEDPGVTPAALNALRRQYLKDPRERAVRYDDRSRHYEAGVLESSSGLPLRGVERLYRRILVVQPTHACPARCRWCLRAHYPSQEMSSDELEAVAVHCGSPELRDDLREVLVSGGEPLLFPRRLEGFLCALARHAPNVRVVRLGTRLPLQAPERIGELVMRALSCRSSLRLEVGLHVNHAGELFPEVRNAIARLGQVARLYSQTVLLAEVNADAESLTELFDELRYLQIEPEYLFHAVPMRGMSHHRTSIERGLALVRALSNSGKLPGRARPCFTAMTDIGKVTLWEGVVQERRGARVLLRTAYRHADRLRWNPSWQFPDSAVIGADGCMSVWYLDGGEVSPPG